MRSKSIVLVSLLAAATAFQGCEQRPEREWDDNYQRDPRRCVTSDNHQIVDDQYCDSPPMSTGAGYLPYYIWMYGGGINNYNGYSRITGGSYAPDPSRGYYAPSTGRTVITPSRGGFGSTWGGSTHGGGLGE